jgi:hypothetical protein
MKLISPYHTAPKSLATMKKWMKKLGFNYEPRKKIYYVDSHKKEATVNY